MATPVILLQIDQTDNGLNTVVQDATIWDIPTNTGVTGVTITMNYTGTSTFTVISEIKSQPCSQANLKWTIPSTALGFGASQPYMDAIYTITVTYTSALSILPLTAQIYFDWNAKFYDLQLVKNLPYYLDNEGFAFNTEIEDSIIFNTLLRGAQYNAAVGQTTKVNDIISIISKYVKIQRDRKGFNYKNWTNTSTASNVNTINEPFFPGFTP